MENERGMSRSRTSSFIFQSPSKRTGPWWFQIIYYLTPGGFIRIYDLPPPRTVRDLTAGPEHWCYFVKWMKLVEWWKETFAGSIWSLLRCNKKPCCARYVNLWKRQDTYLQSYLLTCEISAYLWNIYFYIWTIIVHPLLVFLVCKHSQKLQASTMNFNCLNFAARKVQNKYVLTHVHLWFYEYNKGKGDGKYFSIK